jgi:hypothetical protein
MTPISTTRLPRAMETPSTGSEWSYEDSFCGSETSSPEIVQQSKANGLIDEKVAAGISSLYNIDTALDDIPGPIIRKHGSPMAGILGPNFDIKMDTDRSGIEHNECVDNSALLISPSSKTADVEETLSSSFADLAVQQEKEIVAPAPIKVGDDTDDGYEGEEIGAAELNAMIRTEWIGTSQFFINQGVALQTDVSIVHALLPFHSSSPDTQFSLPSAFLQFLLSPTLFLR